MTTIKSYLDDVIPGFDILKWKEETQAEILQETKGMTQEEILAYFHQASEQAEVRRRKFLERNTSKSPN